MEQSKKSEKTSKDQYSFYFNEQLTGILQISMRTTERKANAKIGIREFQIKQTEIRKNRIKIANQTGEILAKLYPEKWYASTSIFEYAGKTYKVIVRNNPLAEYAIQENGRDLLSYGLDSDNKKIKISIKSSRIMGSMKI